MSGDALTVLIFVGVALVALCVGVVLGAFLQSRAVAAIEKELDAAAGVDGLALPTQTVANDWRGQVL